MTGVVWLGLALVAVTVAVHAAGFTVVLRSLTKSRAVPPVQPWPIAWLLIRVAWLLIALHMLEIAIWALAYRWAGCLPDAEAAFYFSGVTYATIGYGDLVLPKPWRMLGPVEGLTGILMCGLSAGLFFALITRVYASRLEGQPAGPASGARGPASGADQRAGRPE
jgi:hypothetical protein